MAKLARHPPRTAVAVPEWCPMCLSARAEKAPAVAHRWRQARRRRRGPPPRHPTVLSAVPSPELAAFAHVGATGATAPPSGRMAPVDSRRRACGVVAVSLACGLAAPERDGRQRTLPLAPDGAISPKTTWGQRGES